MKPNLRNTFPPHLSILSGVNGEWGLWSVHHTLSLPLLPPQAEDSSHSAPAPTWGPSHRRQFSTNFSNMGPSHGLQAFMNRLLQRGSPTGSKVLPANLLRREVLSAQSWLALALSEAGEASSSFSQKPLPCSSPAIKTLPRKPTTTLKVPIHRKVNRIQSSC